MRGTLVSATRFGQWATALTDAAGIGIVLWLMWQVVFASGESFRQVALVAGAVGIAGAFAASRNRWPRLPIFLIGYASVALLSAAWHQWATVERSEWWRVFEPSQHAAVMIVYVVGVAHLLRTSRRLIVGSMVACVAMLVLAAQTLFDQAISGYEGQPTLQTMLPLVAQWKGVHDLTFVMGLGVPLALAPSVIERRAVVVLAGLVLAALPIAASYAISSRGGTAAMVAVAGTMLVAAVGGPRIVRGGPKLAAAFGLFLAAGIGLAMLGWGPLDSLWTAGGRTGLWAAALQVIGEHPWLGVGPGNYRAAILETGRDPIGHSNAHNLPLHLAAEIGVVGGIFFASFCVDALRRCWKAWVAGEPAAVAVFFSLLLLVIRWSTDTFIEGSLLAERHRIVAWTVFAAALAVARLSQDARQESMSRAK